MILNRIAIAFVLVIAGCSKGCQKSAENAASDDPCKTTATSYMSAIKQPNDPAAATEKLIAVLYNRCVADRWDEQFHRCVQWAEGAKEQLLLCNLSSEQNKNVAKDFLHVMNDQIQSLHKRNAPFR